MRLPIGFRRFRSVLWRLDAGRSSRFSIILIFPRGIVALSLRCPSSSVSRKRERSNLFTFTIHRAALFIRGNSITYCHVYGLPVPRAASFRQRHYAIVSVVRLDCTSDCLLLVCKILFNPIFKRNDFSKSVRRRCFIQDFEETISSNCVSCFSFLSKIWKKESPSV